MPAPGVAEVLSGSARRITLRHNLRKTLTNAGFGALQVGFATCDVLSQAAASVSITIAEYPSKTEVYAVAGAAKPLTLARNAWSCREERLAAFKQYCYLLFGQSESA
jgi:DNA-binding transcriptional regulator PaaX